MVMIDDYKTKGQFIDLSLLQSLTRGLGTVAVLWVASIIWSTAGAIFEEYLLCRETLRKLPIYIPLFLLNQSILMFVPPALAIAEGVRISPLLRGALMTQIFVLGMKHHSFFMTNRYLRKEIPDHNSELSLWELAKEYIVFLCIPTLVYELEYPRQSTMRLHYVAKELFASFLCFLVTYLIIQKHLIPYLSMTEKINFFESIFYLGVPTLMIWMIAFYGIFHGVLNALAELTYYADREFYLAWWDSASMEDFWRLWNRSVYKWMARHVYIESMRQVSFFNRTLASVGTFFVTAFMHEVVLAVAFTFLRPMFFTIIVVQIPYIYFTKLLRHSRWGNIAMWIGFTLGFPILELWYANMYLDIVGYEYAD